MARYGMQGTTVDRVAEEAKVAKGTIYLYFQSKDELVHAAVLEGLREMVAETVSSDNPSMPPLDRIRNLIRAQYRIQASNQDFLKTLIIGNSLDIELESQAGRDFMRVYAGHLDFADLGTPAFDLLHRRIHALLFADRIETAAQAAKSRGLTGKWVLPLRNTTQQPAQAELRNRAVRQRLFELSTLRTARGDTNDTRNTIRRMAELRAEKAKLLGYPSWAAYALETQGAKTPENAIKLLGLDHLQ